jgi:pimeloyl-ACP methyl ester carboxylesterase
MSSSIYRTPQAEAKIKALYDRLLARLNTPTESRTIGTRFGATHVLVAGPAEGAPVVVLHGGNTLNPLNLPWLLPLAKAFRLYAPDTIGHPGRSAPVRLSPRDNSYGEWLCDVLDGLDLPQAALVGGSYGAGILLRAAACAPERISKAVVFIPSGIISIPLSTLLTLLAALARYQLQPSRENVRRLMQPMFAAEPVEALALETTEAVMRYVHIEPEMPRNVTRAELVRFRAPTLLLAAEKDQLFPGAAVLRRARQVFPNLVAAELIEDCPHFIPERYHPRLNQRIAAFLNATV